MTDVSRCTFRDTNEPNYLKKLEENVRIIRKTKSLSLRQMAALCTVDHSDIAKIEKGRVNITILTLVELVKALEVHPGKLIEFGTEL